MFHDKVEIEERNEGKKLEMRATDHSKLPTLLVPQPTPLSAAVSRYA